MRKPPEPPAWESDMARNTMAYINAMRNDDLGALIRQANYNYLHWHKFRYRTFPEGIEPQHAWGALQMQRGMQFRELPIAFFDLDENLKFWNPPRHQEWLHNVDRDAGGRMPTPEDSMPTDERYLFGSLMEEAIASSQLEGASTTREVAKRMLRTERKPRDRPEKMILNNYRTILELRDSKKEKLSPKFLTHIQGILTADTLDNPGHVGRFRTDEDMVAVIDNYSFDVMHTPPTAASLDYRIREICEFANETSHPFIHPVIKACILHFALGFVHPFADGNGRTARAVFYWYMLKKGYWPFQFLPISRIFLRAPAKYARAYLYTETDHGDVTYFVHYHLQVIRRAIAELHEHMRNKQREYSEASVILDALPALNHRQTSLLCHALKNPDDIYTIRHHQGLHHVSYATARSDLLDLEKQKFIDGTLRGNKLVFRPVADLGDRVKALKKKSRKSRQAELPLERF